jgi:hypothetical protein
MTLESTNTLLIVTENKYTTVYISRKYEICATTVLYLILDFDAQNPKKDHAKHSSKLLLEIYSMKRQFIDFITFS